jgi:hypothetical protein
MFARMLEAQWKFTRSALLAVSLLVAITPALVMRLSLVQIVNQTPRDLIVMTELLGSALGVTAVVLGIIVQHLPWDEDQKGRFVYALSLPITWPQFVLRRFGGGLLLLLLPALFAWLGGAIAVALVPIPPTLHTFALGVAMRFYLASAICYAAWSALVHLSGRRVGVVLLALLLVALLVPVGLNWIGYSQSVNAFFNWLVNPPGPLAVFFSRWALIDV